MVNHTMFCLIFVMNWRIKSISRIVGELLFWAMIYQLKMIIIYDCVSMRTFFMTNWAFYA